MTECAELKEIFSELNTRDRNITPALVCSVAKVSTATLYNVLRGKKVSPKSLTAVRKTLLSFRDSKSKLGA